MALDKDKMSKKAYEPYFREAGHCFANFILISILNAGNIRVVCSFFIYIISREHTVCQEIPLKICDLHIVPVSDLCKNYKIM